MKKLLAPFFYAFLRLHLAAHAFILKKFVLNFGAKKNETLLKQYLCVDHETRSAVLAKWGIPLYGVHPKNVFNYRKEFFLDHVNATSVVLDIGCGSGRLLEALSGKIKFGYGIDLHAPRLSVEKNNLKFVTGDVLSFDYKKFQQEVHYNTAIFSHILEHIENPVALLKAIGAENVLVCVPSEENWLTQLKINYKLPYLTDPTHFCEYSRERLRKILVDAGYEVSFIGFNAEGELIGRGQCQK